jgi:DNA-binding NarL/FixJ family response regulator
MLKLLVVEDHALVREGLLGLLSQLDDKAAVEGVGDFAAALRFLAAEEDVDLLLLDLAMPGIDGFAGLDILRKDFPALPVVVVSAFDDPLTVARAMNLGASGFIPKAYSGEALLAAVREVLDGNIFMPAESTSARLDSVAPTPPSPPPILPADLGLTDRQSQVLALMVNGLSNRDIADQLELTEGTVKIHATAIFKTLGVSSRTQALVLVSRHGVDFSMAF